MQVVIFKIFVSIQKNAYPIYDEKKSLRRIEGVKAYLSYAVNKKDWGGEISPQLKKLKLKINISVSRFSLRALLIELMMEILERMK
ncbi:TPA: hypothetical protein RD663_002010 [Enterococcus faecalis]|uniref:hypothetical protein n=1 Tax=Enterococcus faecalis TaxID=1351 RepID=UPI00163C86C6|nr:hypothetical protein [Enterococcus faecalis]HDT8064253.1 hypothetical protein [Enterococcus faecalis]